MIEQIERKPGVVYALMLLLQLVVIPGLAYVAVQQSQTRKDISGVRQSVAVLQSQYTQRAVTVQHELDDHEQRIRRLERQMAHGAVWEPPFRRSAPHPRKAAVVESRPMLRWVM